MKTKILDDECNKYGGFVNVITNCGGTLVSQIWLRTMQEYADQQTKELREEIVEINKRKTEDENDFVKAINQVDDNNRLLREEIDRLKESKWISVDDDLPKRIRVLNMISDSVMGILFKDKHNYIYYGSYNHSYKIWIVSDYKGGVFNIENVTHWQPLPNNPI